MLRARELAAYGTYRPVPTMVVILDVDGADLLRLRDLAHSDTIWVC